MTKSKKQKLTKKTLDSLKPDDKRYVVWDSQITGYGVRIYPTGRKMFFIQYRNKNSELRWFNLGQYGHITPDQARESARIELGRVTKGYDPSEEKRLKLKEITVSELCDFYLKEGCKHKKASSIQTDQARIEWHIKPLLGKKKITSIRRSDVEKMKNDIAEGKTSTQKKTRKHGKAVVRGGKGAASRTISLLSAIYTFAMSRDLVIDNPCKGVKKFATQNCNRFLSPKEFKDLGDVLIELESKEHPSAINIIRLLIFTGCRRSEIQTLKWEYIDWDQSCINLPDSKTGKKTIRLGKPAIEILRNQTKVQNNPYVFHGHKKGQYFVGLTKAWNRIKSQRESLGDLRLHDLRHSFASVGVSGGHSLIIIGTLLGHKSTGTTSRYAHLSDDPVRSVNDDIGEQIQKYMNSEK